MTRADFERQVSAEFGKTIAEMRADGYWSAKCEEKDKCEWQHFAIPPGSSEKERNGVLANFRRPIARRDLNPQRFGGDGHG